MKKICIDKVTIEDLDNIEVGDWIDGVGSILTLHERFLARGFGKVLLRHGIIFANKKRGFKKLD